MRCSFVDYAVRIATLSIIGRSLLVAWSGMVYAVFVIGAYSRRVLGWERDAHEGRCLPGNLPRPVDRAGATIGTSPAEDSRFGSSNAADQTGRL